MWTLRSSEGQGPVLVCVVRPRVRVCVTQMRGPAHTLLPFPPANLKRTLLKHRVEKAGDAGFTVLTGGVLVMYYEWPDMSEILWNHKEIQFKFLHTVESLLFIHTLFTCIVHFSKFCTEKWEAKCCEFASSRYWLIFFVAFCAKKPLLAFHFHLSLCVLCTYVYV